MCCAVCAVCIAGVHQYTVAKHHLEGRAVISGQGSTLRAGQCCQGLHGALHMHACMVHCTCMPAWCIAHACLHGASHMHACMVHRTCMPAWCIAHACLHGALHMHARCTWLPACGAGRCVGGGGLLLPAIHSDCRRDQT